MNGTIILYIITYWVKIYKLSSRGEVIVMLKEMLNPNLYHGRHPWNVFEGWYFKLTDNQNNTFAFIPGIYWGNKSKGAHSFLQVLEGKSLSYNYHKFATDDFRASHQPFSIFVKDNSFSLNSISLNIDNCNQRLYGELKFKNHFKWPDSFYSPGSMGAFNFIPFLQCYSQVCAMNMEVEGKLFLNGATYIFKNGRGYIEKNWGNAFPYSWVWIQSNSFSEKNVALSCSIGHIPFLTSSFRGFLVGLQFKEAFISFTTMKGSRLKVIPRNRDLSLTLCNKDYKLEIHTKSSPNDFILCNGPREGGMVPLVEECLNGEVIIKLRELKTGKLIYEDIGKAAGIEYGGDSIKILNK